MITDQIDDEAKIPTWEAVTKQKWTTEIEGEERQMRWWF